jgi:molybdenum cofactor synthesis domain-containing protein
VLAEGEAIRIMTGAPVPAGADTIVMVEDTERLDGGSRVRITACPDLGAAIRPIGDDVSAGTVLYPAGTVITPAVAAVLATVNASQVPVVTRPRVAVLSTGDELVEHDGPMEPGQIRESNRTMLLGLVADAGAEAVDYGTVVDDEAALESVLRRAASECDAIVTSGGVSMGDYDVVKAVLSRIADMHWMQIAIKPAKPFAFGLLEATGTAGGVKRRVQVFGLPGNPVSSLVSFELLARPALRQMAGRRDVHRPTVLAIADEGLSRRPDGKVHFQRVIGEFGSDGRLHVRSVGKQASHQLAATSLANGIAELPDGNGVQSGGEVSTILLWNT